MELFPPKSHIVGGYAICWAHKTTLNPPLCIEVSGPIQENEWSCMC